MQIFCDFLLCAITNFYNYCVLYGLFVISCSVALLAVAVCVALRALSRLLWALSRVLCRRLCVYRVESAAFLEAFYIVFAGVRCQFLRRCVGASVGLLTVGGRR